MASGAGSGTWTTLWYALLVFKFTPRPPDRRAILKVVNIGDSLEMLSGGFYKGTIHRVVQPPADQRGYERLGVFYFALADDDVKLVPCAESPVLQRVGIKRRVADEDAPNQEQMRKARTAAYGTSTLKKREDGHEEEVLAGITVKHFN